MKENKEEILALAERLNDIIIAKTQESEETRWKDVWMEFKRTISYKIEKEKTELKELDDGNFTVHKAITEGYILALENILTEMGYYGE